MTIERPMFPPRAGNSVLRLVGGIDCTPSPESGPAPAPSPRKRKLPKRQQPKEYQDGVPVIDPAGEEDPIFQEIAKHRAAIVQYDRCVEVENAAEERGASDNELFYVRHNTKLACDDLMLWARAVILCRPTTRRGLIHQVRNLASQFTEPEACNSGGPYLPDNIGENPWQLAFLRNLAAGLRKMGTELDTPEQGGAA
jgi:hypothetical protein